MCGIAGFVSTTAQADPQRLLQTLAQAQAHRGPDATGYYTHPNAHIGLAHNRLSILDLRPEGNQPFFDRTSRYAIIHNGEVYNYRQIAEELGIPLRTSTDTEVLVEGFAQWGPAVVEKCAGMFAFVILDIATEELFLFRDRVGIKPLFVYQSAELVVFASELKAIQALGLELTVDTRTFGTFLNLNFIPGPGTVYHEVMKFPQGHWAKLTPGSPVKPVPYWQLDAQLRPTTGPKDEKEALSQLRGLLEEVVSEQLVADVPLGCFLSGGTDSTLVTALATRLSSTPVNTFTIGFKEEGYNEAPHAREVATYLKTNHFETIVTETDALAYLDLMPAIYDEPYTSLSAFPTLVLCEQARKQLTVALAGDGGDEAFMSYGTYTWARRLEHPLVKLLRPLLRIGLELAPTPRLRRVSEHFALPKDIPLRQQTFSLEQGGLPEKSIRAILQGYAPPYSLTSPNESLHSRRLSAAEMQALQDFLYYEPDDLLVKVDRASMYHSLEVRVPLLDHRIVAFAINLPENFRYHPKKGMKYLLKRVLYQLVPKSMLDRPKWGFPAPMASWLKHELRFLLEEELGDSHLFEVGLYNHKSVAALRDLFIAGGRDDLDRTLWNLLLLQRWYLSHFGNKINS